MDAGALGQLATYIFTGLGIAFFIVGVARLAKRILGHTESKEQNPGTGNGEAQERGKISREGRRLQVSEKKGPEQPP